MRFFFLTESYNKTENSNTSFGYLVFITKVIESANLSVLNFNHNNTGINYSNCPPILSLVFVLMMGILMKHNI